MIRLLLTAAYIVVNVLAAAAFASDRRRVICSTPKISRRVLLTASLLGPFGARISIGSTGCAIGRNWFMLIYLAMAVHTSLAVWVFFYL